MLYIFMNVSAYLRVLLNMAFFLRVCVCVCVCLGFLYEHACTAVHMGAYIYLLVNVTSDIFPCMCLDFHYLGLCAHSHTFECVHLNVCLR